MLKINKVFSYKIISIIVIMTFTTTSICYSINLPKRSYLRAPLLSNLYKQRLADGLEQLSGGQLNEQVLEDIWKEFSKRFPRVISPKTGRPRPGTGACEKISLIAAKVLAKLGAKDIIIVYQEKGMEYHAWVECIWKASLYVIDASAGMLEKNPVHGKIIKAVPVAYEGMNAEDRAIYLGEEGGVFLYFFVTGKEKEINSLRPHRIIPVSERLLDLEERYKLGDLIKDKRVKQAAILEAPERVKRLIMTELRGKKELSPWYVALQLKISIDAADKALDGLVVDGQLYMTKGKYYWVISGGSGLSRTNLPAGIDLEKVNADELKYLKRWEFGQAVSVWYKAEVPFLTLIGYGDYMLKSSIKGYRYDPRSKEYALLPTEPPRIIVLYDEGTMEFSVRDGMHRLGAAYVKGDMQAPIEAYIGIIEQDLGSPSSVFKLVSDGKLHTRKNIANALNRSERTIQLDLYFLVKAGLLKRLDVATYQINQELLENPDLISSIQPILDEEFKYGKITKNLKSQEERERIIEIINSIKEDKRIMLQIKQIALNVKIIAIDFGGTLVPTDSNIIAIDDFLLGCLWAMDLLLLADDELNIHIVSGGSVTKEKIEQIIELFPSSFHMLRDSGRFKVSERIIDKGQRLEEILQEARLPETSIIAIGDNEETDRPMALKEGYFVKVYPHTRSVSPNVLDVLERILEVKTKFVIKGLYPILDIYRSL